jgi:hypothetical protein
MLEQRWLVSAGAEFKATRLGREKLAALGIDPGAEHQGRRAYARGCVDLTQRRPHLAGTLGAALLALYVREGWVLRSPRSRVVSITSRGREAFRRKLGVSM